MGSVVAALRNDSVKLRTSITINGDLPVWTMGGWVGENVMVRMIRLTTGGKILSCQQVGVKSNWQDSSFLVEVIDCRHPVTARCSAKGTVLSNLKSLEAFG